MGLEDQASGVIVVPYESLSENALNGVLEEFITREGTDYGNDEVDLAAKLVEAKNKLLKADVVIVFDLKSERIQLLTQQQYEILKSQEDQM